jgi:hypothetical protein
MSSGDDAEEARRRAELALADDQVEALRRAILINDGLRRELAALQARFNVLTDVLVAAELLAPGHLTLMDNEARDAANLGKRPTIQLRVLDGKPAPAAEIDCASRVHLCHARCCTMQVTLCEPELADGIAWEIEQPYLMRRGVDGYCHYIDRGGGGCTIYERRPYECRIYDCRNDTRIWVDFERRIPAELPASFQPVLKPRP